jgi:hypothetical protein
MSESAQPGTSTAGGVRSRPSEQGYAVRSAWGGWIFFAGAMMILQGLFNAIEGLVALFRPHYYVVGPNGLLVFSLTGWGWIHLIIGILVVLAGIAVFSGALWARVTGVVLAVINAIAQLAFLSAYPVWATIVIAIDVVVIWALIAHGSEVERSETW